MRIPYILAKIFKTSHSTDKSVEAFVYKRDEKVHITEPEDKLSLKENLSVVIKEVIKPQIRDITLDLEDNLGLSDSSSNTYVKLIESNLTLQEQLHKPILKIRIIDYILFSDSKFMPLIRSLLDTLGFSDSLRETRLKLIEETLSIDDQIVDSYDRVIYTQVIDRIRLNDNVTY